MGRLVQECRKATIKVVLKVKGLCTTVTCDMGVFFLKYLEVFQIDILLNISTDFCSACYIT